MMAENIEQRMLPRDLPSHQVMTASRNDGPPPMPESIANAIDDVMSEIERIEEREKNRYGGYNFASIDDIYDLVRPLMAKARLVVKPRWHHMPGKDDLMERVQMTGEKVQVRAWFTYVLQCGKDTWHDPGDVWPVQCNWMGSQTTGALVSFAERYYLKPLFKLSTGDVDPEEMARMEDPEEVQPAKRAAKAQSKGKAPPKDAVQLHMERQQLRWIKLDKVVDEVREFLLTLDHGAWVKWLEYNRHQMARLKEADKTAWVEVKRIAESKPADGDEVPPKTIGETNTANGEAEGDFPGDTPPPAENQEGLSF